MIRKIGKLKDSRFSNPGWFQIGPALQWLVVEIVETPLFKKSKFDHEPVESLWLSKNQPISLKFHIQTIQTFKKLLVNFQLPDKEVFGFFISVTF